MDGDLGEIQAKLTAELNENINSIDRRKTFKGTKVLLPIILQIKNHVFRFLLNETKLQSVQMVQETPLI